MKKLLTILLLGSMLLFSVGYYIVYQFNLYSIKQQMRLAVQQGKFSSNQLVTFTFDATDANAIRDLEIKEKGKEIRFKGKMYDVVDTKMLGSKLSITCLPDDDETQVIAGFAKFLDANDAGTGKKAVKMVKYNMPVFLVEELPVVNFNSLENNTRYSLYQTGFIPVQFLNKPSPPPWQA